MLSRQVRGQPTLSFPYRPFVTEYENWLNTLEPCNRGDIYDRAALLFLHLACHGLHPKSYRCNSHHHPLEILLEDRVSRSNKEFGVVDQHNRSACICQAVNNCRPVPLIGHIEVLEDS